MKKILMASAVALASIDGTAQAATTVQITSPALKLYDMGNSSTSGYHAGLTALAPLATNPTVTITSGGALPTGVYSGTGTGYTSPFTDATKNYFAVEPNGSITFGYNTAQTSFGLLFGTIDSYNNLSFTTNGATPQTFTGADVAAALSMSNGGSQTANVFFSNLNPFTSVTLTSSTSAFEFALAQGAVPEPAAWGMMIVGFGLVGGVMRRRQAAVKVRFA